MRLQRYSGNPILSPHPDHPWEDLAVFNPAAWYDKQRKEVLLLYRAADPDFQKNRDFPRDMFNLAVGLVWQVSLECRP